MKAIFSITKLFSYVAANRYSEYLRVWVCMVVVYVTAPSVHHWFNVEEIPNLRFDFNEISAWW